MASNASKHEEMVMLFYCYWKCTIKKQRKRDCSDYLTVFYTHKSYEGFLCVLCPRQSEHNPTAWFPKSDPLRTFISQLPTIFYFLQTLTLLTEWQIAFRSMKTLSTNASIKPWVWVWAVTFDGSILLVAGLLLNIFTEKFPQINENSYEPFRMQLSFPSIREHLHNLDIVNSAYLSPISLLFIMMLLLLF